MSVLDKDKKKREWKLTIGNSKQMRPTFGSCLTTALTHIDKVILLAEKCYKEDVNDLRIVRHEMDKLKMVQGRMEWHLKIGPGKGYIAIEKIGTE